MAKIINCDGEVRVAEPDSLVKEIPVKKPKKVSVPAEEPLRFRYLWLLIVLLVLITAGIVYYLI